jgi:hypothetical protein
LGLLTARSGNRAVSILADRGTRLRLMDDEMQLA